MPDCFQCDTELPVIVTARVLPLRLIPRTPPPLPNTRLPVIATSRIGFVAPDLTSRIPSPIESAAMLIVLPVIAQPCSSKSVEPPTKMPMA
jgi:hypothetical protein